MEVCGGLTTHLILLLLCFGSALAATDCGKGWVLSANGDDCYYVNSTASLTWHEAYQWCISQDADLISVRNATEQQFMIGHRWGLGGLWIGLHNRDTTKLNAFVWTDKTAYEYTHWPHGRAPQGGDADDSCVRVGADGYWDAADCSLQMGIACRRPSSTPLPTVNHTTENITTSTQCGGWYEHNGLCYQYFRRHANWLTARSKCFKAGGFLVDILSAHEVAFMKSFGRRLHVQSFWMGLNCRLNTSTFVWDDGTVGGHQLTTNAAALAWGRNEPNNHYGHEHCTEMQQSPMLVWNDLRCDASRAYVCKRHKSTDGHYADITPKQPTTCPHTYSMFTHPVNGAVYCYHRRGSPHRYTSLRSWSSAAKDCEDSGQELVSIGDHYENDFVRSHVLSTYFYPYSRVWIGIASDYETGNYNWRSGAAVSFTRWSVYASLHPSKKHQQCGYMYRYSSHWRTADCAGRNSYICKLTLIRPRQNKKAPVPAEEKFCAAGWRLRDGFCYYVSPTTVSSRNLADSGCMVMNSHLVSIHSLAEQAYVSSLLASQQHQADAYMGLSDRVLEGEYRWDDFSLVDFSFWASGEPNDHNKQDCVKLYKHKSTWNDVSCTANLSLSYICKKPADESVPKSGSPDSKCPTGWRQFNTKCYKLMETPLAFVDADRKCSTFLAKSGKPGVLATTTSRADNFFLTSLALGAADNESATVWIGMNDRATEGMYAWTSKQPVLFVNWASGQPSESRTTSAGKGVKNCVTLHTDTAEWSDEQCSLAQNFVCMTDDSDQSSSTKGPPTTNAPSVPGAGCEVGWLQKGSTCYGFFGSITNATVHMQRPVIAPQSWQAADQVCREYGATLASFHDTATHDWVAKTFDETLKSGVFGYWIGLSQDGFGKGGYRWTDGSVLDYTKWAVLEPNDLRGSEDCVEVILSQRIKDYYRRWNDYSCSAKRAFVCTIAVGKPFSKPTPEPTSKPPSGLTKVPCAKGWIQTADSCFWLGMKPLTWLFANRKCAAREKAGVVPAGAKVSLASIHKQDEHMVVADAIMTAAETMDNATNYWIGLNDRVNESQYVWADGSPVDYLSWSIGEPNDYNHHQDCGQIKGAYGFLFNDASCSHQYNYVCGHSRYLPSPEPTPSCDPGTVCHTECPQDWQRHGDSCYFGVSTKMDFNEATQNCSGYNTNAMEDSDLVTVNSVEESKWLTRTFFTDDAFYWIGFSDEDQENHWRWASGERNTYTNWNSGQPNNNYGRNGGENCAAADGESGGKWYDRPCDSYFRFVCEMPVQIVLETVPPPTVTSTASTSSSVSTGVETNARHDAAKGANGSGGLSPVATALIGVLTTLMFMAIIIFVIVMVYRHQQRVRAGLAGPVGFRRLRAEDDEDDDNLLVE